MLGLLAAGLGLSAQRGKKRAGGGFLLSHAFAKGQSGRSVGGFNNIAHKRLGWGMNNHPSVAIIIVVLNYHHPAIYHTRTSYFATMTTTQPPTPKRRTFNPTTSSHARLFTRTSSEQAGERYGIEDDTTWKVFGVGARIRQSE